MHEGLAWELAAGSRAQHLLVLSPEGDPELRPIAHRWLRSAPPADADWEYAAARQAVAEPEQIMLGIEQVELSFGDIRVGARREGTRVDVDVYHPAFAEVEEPVRRQVAYLALDAALGEDDVEAWVGEVTTSAQPPLEGFGLRGLRAVVRDLRDDYLGDDGTPQWVALEAQGEDGPVLAMAQVPLSPVTAPHLDTHVAVLVPTRTSPSGDTPGPGRWSRCAPWRTTWLRGSATADASSRTSHTAGCGSCTSMSTPPRLRSSRCGPPSTRGSRDGSGCR